MVFEHMVFERVVFERVVFGQMIVEQIRNGAGSPVGAEGPVGALAIEG